MTFVGTNTKSSILYLDSHISFLYNAVLFSEWYGFLTIDPYNNKLLVANTV